MQLFLCRGRKTSPPIGVMDSAKGSSKGGKGGGKGSTMMGGKGGARGGKNANGKTPKADEEKQKRLNKKSNVAKDTA